MIFISAGHHSDKPGACYKGFCEHEEAKQWTSILVNYLGGFGIVVPSGTLRNKIAFINGRATKESKAVEIHFNSAMFNGEHVGKGSETLYYPGSKNGIDLAAKIQTSIATLFMPNRGIKEGYYQMNPSKGIDFFLKHTICTAIIIEPDFIHRKEIIQENREVCCERMAKVLLNE